MSAARQDYILRLIEAVALLSDPRQILLWAELLQVKAEAHRRMGEAARANALEAQAAGLLREAFPRT